MSEGSHSHYHAVLRRKFWKCNELAVYPLAEVQILVIKDTSMLSSKCQVLPWGKCPDWQHVFTKNVRMNWEMRDLASTNQWYTWWLESKDGPSYMFLWCLFCIITEFGNFLWIFEEEDYQLWRNVNSPH